MHILFISIYVYIYVYNSLSPSIAIATHLATTSGPSTPTGVTRNVGIPSRDATPRSPGKARAAQVDQWQFLLIMML